jgi:hypothetical protein
MAVKTSALTKALVPLGVVTSIPCWPGPCTGETTVIWVEETTVKFVVATPPKWTVVAPVNPVPVMVTVVPPAGRP